MRHPTPLRRLTHALTLSVFMCCATAHAAPAAPRDKSSLLYYKIGGSESVSRAANPGTLSVRLGLSGVAKLNYSCGKFNAQVSVQNLMNNVRQWGTQLGNAVQQGVAALPMYVLQRAQPGLYEMLQTYIAKAEKTFDFALKSCEEMEQTIRDGGDPYEDYIKAAKALDWKFQTEVTTDVVSAKRTVEQTGGDKGVPWIKGPNAGGANQLPVRPVRDSAMAGFNLTMNRPVSTPDHAGVANPLDYRLTRAFATPQAAGDWAVQVLGDHEIATCSHPACPGKGAINGSGLLPRFEQEFSTSLQQIRVLANGTGVPPVARLDEATAPGVAVSRELIEALRVMPPAEREAMSLRLAMEIAQARLLDKALIVRDLMQTALSGIPQISAIPASGTIKEKLDTLNKLIASAAEDIRIRREIVSTTAVALVESYRASQAQSTSVAPSAKTDPHPLVGGRAAP